MAHLPALTRLVDLTRPADNMLFNVTLEEARARVAAGDAAGVAAIDGQFAIVAANGQIVRLARSIGRPLRYFIAKHHDGPWLIAADRIDAIHKYLQAEGLAGQFHPSYTRMAPAHYLTEVALTGCPDPSPRHERFFTPERNSLPADLHAIGAAYVRALHDAIVQWLKARASSGPIGVCFSGGIDSGAIFLVTYHAMQTLGMHPGRLKAFTLSVHGDGADLAQAREFLRAVGMEYFLDPIKIAQETLNWREAVHVMEDYKPLDVQSATMALALCRGIRHRYPDWRLLIDGDGGDENLKDYPIEDNPELTIRSVLNNPLLYQEGWGVDSLKHSLTYSGGLSRGYVRTFAPAAACGFEGFSPFTLPRVIAVAESIPFIELTQWRHESLYRLKGEIVAHGIKAVTGFELPVYNKRRFQHGVAHLHAIDDLFPRSPSAYRREFLAAYESTHAMD